MVKLYLEDTITKVLQVMLPLWKQYRVPDGKDKISHSCENADTNYPQISILLKQVILS